MKRKIRLRTWIKQVGRKEIARLLDVTPMAVTHWKQGDAIPGAETLRKIVRLTDGKLDVEHVLLGNGRRK